MRKNDHHSTPLPDTYALAVCALLTALSVVLARILTVIPSEVSRFSLEALPVLLAGLLFGPWAGGGVGFSADLIGCLFSPYGYNPIFCLPPILYGVWAGLLRRRVWTRPSLPRMALVVYPPAAIGSVLWQSMALALVYGGDAKQPFFLSQLGIRSVQFAVTGTILTVLLWLLLRRNALEPVLRRIREREASRHDH